MKEPESCSFLLPQWPLCRLFPLPECPAPTRGDIYFFVIYRLFSLLWQHVSDFLWGIFYSSISQHGCDADSTPVPGLALTGLAITQDEPMRLVLKPLGCSLFPLSH